MSHCVRQTVQRPWWTVWQRELYFDPWRHFQVCASQTRNLCIWDFIMHGPDGHDYRNRIQFIDIRKPHHISYKHLGDGEGAKDVEFQTTIIFEEAGEGTNLTMEQLFPSKEELERINNRYGAIECAKQHIGNLGTFLEKLKKNSESRKRM